MKRPATAVIPAAGRGWRMGEAGRLRPKGFIELGGRALIEMSLDRLREAGVERAIVITGHCADHYEKLAASRPGIELVHNPRYADSGSMLSLYSARGRIDGDFVLLESDLVYERRALAALFGSPAENTLLVSGRTDSGDEVYVEAAEGRLTGLSKQRSTLGGQVIGELVGITRMTKACLDAMCDYAEGELPKTPRLDYEQALVAAARSTRVECLLVPDLAWTEIDDAQHLARAVTTVYPRIVERDRS